MNVHLNRKCPATVKASACISPVAAYNALAPHYNSLLDRRRSYLQAVEAVITAAAAKASSLLDIGSGNGVRASRIAKVIQIKNVVLVEPSEGMRRQAEKIEGIVWKASTSQVPETAHFDLITCLWNVLGHLEDSQERLKLLLKLKSLLSPCGSLFLDVNHRYNAASYGWFWTASRMMRDLCIPSEKNGDVIACWQAGNQRICTRGHVFTHAELAGLFRRAGLRVKARWVIDYRTGATRRFSVSGNLLYQLMA